MQKIKQIWMLDRFDGVPTTCKESTGDSKPSEVLEEVEHEDKLSPDGAVPVTEAQTSPQWGGPTRQSYASVLMSQPGQVKDWQSREEKALDDAVRWEGDAKLFVGLAVDSFS